MRDVVLSETDEKIIGNSNLASYADLENIGTKQISSRRRKIRQNYNFSRKKLTGKSDLTWKFAACRLRHRAAEAAAALPVALAPEAQQRGQQKHQSAAHDDQRPRNIS